jgi:hypothetical protein
MVPRLPDRPLRHDQELGGSSLAHHFRLACNGLSGMQVNGLRAPSAAEQEKTLATADRTALWSNWPRSVALLHGMGARRPANYGTFVASMQVTRLSRDAAEL